MKVSLVVPVYNERDTIETVLSRLEAVALPAEKEIILVDDFSTDGTRKWLGQLPADRAVVLLHDRNRGKGAAIRTALERATGDIIAIQDADLEYNPEELPQLVAPLVEGRAKVVYGSRFRGRIQGMRLANRIANRILAALANLLFRVGITDEATCYKLIEANLLRSLNLRCERFEFCPEVTAKLGKRGIPILEIPITYVARSAREGKKIAFKDGLTAIWTLIKYRFVD